MFSKKLGKEYANPAVASQLEKGMDAMNAMKPSAGQSDGSDMAHVELDESPDGSWTCTCTGEDGQPETTNYSSLQEALDYVEKAHGGGGDEDEGMPGMGEENAQ